MYDYLRICMPPKVLFVVALCIFIDTFDILSTDDLHIS